MLRSAASCRLLTCGPGGDGGGGGKGPGVWDPRRVWEELVPSPDARVVVALATAAAQGAAAEEGPSAVICITGDALAGQASALFVQMREATAAGAPRWTSHCAHTGAAPAAAAAAVCATGACDGPLGCWGEDTDAGSGAWPLAGGAYVYRGGAGRAANAACGAVVLARADGSLDLLRATPANCAADAGGGGDPATVTAPLAHLRTLSLAELLTAASAEWLARAVAVSDRGLPPPPPPDGDSPLPPTLRTMTTEDAQVAAAPAAQLSMPPPLPASPAKHGAAPLSADAVSASLAADAAAAAEASVGRLCATAVCVNARARVLAVGLVSGAVALIRLGTGRASDVLLRVLGPAALSPSFASRDAAPLRLALCPSESLLACVTERGGVFVGRLGEAGDGCSALLIECPLGLSVRCAVTGGGGGGGVMAVSAGGRAGVVRRVCGAAALAGCTGAAVAGQ